MAASGPSDLTLGQLTALVDDDTNAEHHLKSTVEPAAASSPGVRRLSFLARSQLRGSHPDLVRELATEANAGRRDRPARRGPRRRGTFFGFIKERIRAPRAR